MYHPILILPCIKIRNADSLDIGLNINECLNISDGLILNTQQKDAFDILDEYIDSLDCTLEGRNFSYKVENYNPVDDIQTIMLKLYRILLVYRNAKEHERSAINETNEKIEVLRKNKSSGIIISKEGLNLIHSAVVLAVLPNNFTEKYSNYFIASLLYKYYQDSISEISKFQDRWGDISTLLLNLDYTLVNRVSRMSMACVPFETNDDKLRITVNKNIFPGRKELYGEVFDFNIYFLGRCYNIPSETLNETEEIDIDELKKYEVNIQQCN